MIEITVTNEELQKLWDAFVLWNLAWFGIVAVVVVYGLVQAWRDKRKERETWSAVRRQLTKR